MHTDAIGLDNLGTGRDRVLFVLKTGGQQTAGQIAKKLDLTTMAVRQHLAVLEKEKQVDFTDHHQKVGRPARLWRLTPKSYERFPDHHAELAVGMLQAIQITFGEQGLARLTEERMRQQIEHYQAKMPDINSPLEMRMTALAKIRHEEGYMAELTSHCNGTFDLVEHHCSIADAARLCQSLCGCELSLFRAVLGEDVSVERSEHILAGDQRCSYIVEKKELD